MDIAKIVARIRLVYHSNMSSVWKDLTTSYRKNVRISRTGVNKRSSFFLKGEKSS